MLGGFKEELTKIIKDNKVLFSLLLVAVVALVAIKMITPSSEPVKAPLVINEEITPTMSTVKGTVWREMEQQLEKDLSKFLSDIKNCGRVQVMIRISKDESKIRAIDEDKTEKTIEEIDSTGTTRTTKEVRIIQKTVQESSSSGYKTVFLEVESPEIEGVIVIASGATNLKVKAMLIEAICTYFNIPAYKISVMPGGK